jgi:hypothetical protein
MLFAESDRQRLVADEWYSDPQIAADRARLAAYARRAASRSIRHVRRHKGLCDPTTPSNNSECEQGGPHSSLPVDPNCCASDTERRILEFERQADGLQVLDSFQPVGNSVPTREILAQVSSKPALLHPAFFSSLFADSICPANVFEVPAALRLGERFHGFFWMGHITGTLSWRLIEPRFCELVVRRVLRVARCRHRAARLPF